MIEQDASPLDDRLPSPWADELAVVSALRQSLAGALDWSVVRQRCEPWIEGVRRHPGPAWAMESLLHEFPLSSHEGRALMRLAEALLRVPDAQTALALTADQLASQPSPNAAPTALAQGQTHGLAHRLSQQVLALAQRILPTADHAPQGWLQRLGGPTVVAATVRAVQLMGHQFVMGQTIAQALSNARQQQQKAQAHGQRLCFSFDMLGEGARTWQDAQRYEDAYRDALKRIAQEPRQTGQGHDGLSIKLSALHPRFESAHAKHVRQSLVPKLLALSATAAQAGLLLTLDAEESWRLELQLQVLDALLQVMAQAPQASTLTSWTGLGVAVQAYQLRAPAVIDAVAHLAARHQRRLTVRLVKGAYWDTEIKRAQELGLPGYPVFTRKAHTDLSYLACAQRLLSHAHCLSPQFATHNAATVAAVMQLVAQSKADSAKSQGLAAANIEWQRLHGMGDATWREVMADAAHQGAHAPLLRVYAPVGAHRDLLAYLVRRLLENGANNSFVHQLLDTNVSPNALLASPLLAAGDNTKPDMPAPTQASCDWAQAAGRDLHAQTHRMALQAALGHAKQRHAQTQAPPPLSVQDADALMQRLQAAFTAWEATAAAQRRAVMQAVADRMEAQLDDWAADLVIEAHKTWADAVAEVRETIDFARYYAQQATSALATQTLGGPTGELNEWRLRGRGVWVCIAPWNFPLAIFAGQVMAALLMGNTVAAKPAEQTPRIAHRFVDFLHDCGLPVDVVLLAPGPGNTVGHALVCHPLCAGVAFTGSGPTAKRIQKALLRDDASPIVPLIAETGGINALIADSTALPEQLLDSVMLSAFGSAGQRCSALRLLCLHTSVATAFEHLLAGAMHTLVVGDPSNWDTDVGPVIDAAAAHGLNAHLAALHAQAQHPDSDVRLIEATPARFESTGDEMSTQNDNPWHFVAPTAYAIPDVGWLRAEHFGPILHVVRWGPGSRAETLDSLIDQINALGFGLTLGIHTRIDSRVQHIAQRLRVGNVYVNRGMTGAVVGVQPFGGQGLSGTGPKAGGPLYLSRFATEQVVCTNTAAAGGNAALMSRPA